MEKPVLQRIGGWPADRMVIGKIISPTSNLGANEECPLCACLK